MWDLVAKKAFKSSLNSVFSGMTTGDNSAFANGLSNSLVSYINKGSVSTVDAGTISTGVFKGGGTGNIIVTPATCSAAILLACNTMWEHRGDEVNLYGESYIAKEIAKAIKSMTDGGIVVTDVTGTVTTPSGEAPMKGSAKGTFSCSTTTLEASLLTTFNSMYTRREEEGFDGNSFFADEFVSAIDTYLLAGNVSTDGLVNLIGSKGTGKIT